MWLNCRMKQRNASCQPVTGESAQTNTAPSAEATTISREASPKPPAVTPFCDFSGLMEHLPMYGARTARQLVKDKIIPSIRPPGSRKLAFHIPSVERSLLRFQKGGIGE